MLSVTGKARALQRHVVTLAPKALAGKILGTTSESPPNLSFGTGSACSAENLTSDESFPLDMSLRSKIVTDEGFEVHITEENGKWLIINVNSLSYAVYLQLIIFLDYVLKNKTIALAGLSGVVGGMAVWVGGRSVAAFSWNEFLFPSNAVSNSLLSKLFSLYAFSIPIFQFRDDAWQREQRALIHSEHLSFATRHANAQLDSNRMYEDPLSLMTIEHPVVVYENGVRQLFEKFTLRHHFLYQTHRLGKSFETVENPITNLPFRNPFHSIDEIVEDIEVQKEISEYKTRLVHDSLQELRNTASLNPNVPNKFYQRMERAITHFLIACNGGPLAALGSSVLGFMSTPSPTLHLHEGEEGPTLKFIS